MDGEREKTYVSFRKILPKYFIKNGNLYYFEEREERFIINGFTIKYDKETKIIKKIYAYGFHPNINYKNNEFCMNTDNVLYFDENTIEEAVFKYINVHNLDSCYFIPIYIAKFKIIETKKIIKRGDIKYVKLFNS